MHYKNVFPLIVYLENPTMIILKVIILKKKNGMYDMLNVYIFLMKERVNQHVNCTHGEERSDHIQFRAKRDVNITLHWPT